MTSCRAGARALAVEPLRHASCAGDEQGTPRAVVRGARPRVEGVASPKDGVASPATRDAARAGRDGPSQRARGGEGRLERDQALALAAGGRKGGAR